MGGGGGGEAGIGQAHPKELDQTPTWAVAVVVSIIILISTVLEKILHRIGEVITYLQNYWSFRLYGFFFLFFFFDMENWRKMILFF